MSADKLKHFSLRRVHSCPPSRPQPFDMIVQAVCRRNSSVSEAVSEARKTLDLLSQRGRVVDLDVVNASGMTALTQCVLDGSLRSVKTLIELGANVDTKDQQGWTALHYAASEGYIEIVRFLLKCNADVRALEREGHMPVDLAEDDEVRKLLIRVTLFLSPIGKSLNRQCSLPVWL